MRGYFISLFLFSFMAMPLTSFAQSEPVPRTDPDFFRKRANADMAYTYQKIVNEVILRKKLTKVQMMSLRALYPGTKDYDAFSDKIIEKLIKVSFDAQQATDQDQKQKLYNEFKTIALAHIANLEVMMLAKSISNDDVGFGNSGFYEQAEKFIYETIVDGRDGKTYQTAYRVLTFGEEEVLLKRIHKKGKLYSSKSYEEENGYYNIHDYRNRSKELTQRIVVDLSIPISKVRDKQKDEDSLNNRIKKF